MTHKTLTGGMAPRIPAAVGQTGSADEMRFFTIAEVAEIVGVSTRTVRRWIKSGELAAHRFGSAVRIADSDLKAFIARQRQS